MAANQNSRLTLTEWPGGLPSCTHRRHFGPTPVAGVGKIARNTDELLAGFRLARSVISLPRSVGLQDSVDGGPASYPGLTLEWLTGGRRQNVRTQERALATGILTEPRHVRRPRAAVAPGTGGGGCGGGERWLASSWRRSTRCPGWRTVPATVQFGRGSRQAGIPATAARPAKSRRCRAIPDVCVTVVMIMARGFTQASRS